MLLGSQCGFPVVMGDGVANVRFRNPETPPRMVQARSKLEWIRAVSCLEIPLSSTSTANTASLECGGISIPQKK